MQQTLTPTRIAATGIAAAQTRPVTGPSGRTCAPRARTTRSQPGVRRRASGRPEALAHSRPLDRDRRSPARQIELSPRAAGTRCAAPVTASRRRSAGAVIAVLTGIALALLVWLIAVAGSGYEEAAAPTPVATQVVHVRAGESLSSVAQRIAPDVPQEAVVAKIMELNDMSVSAVRVGQPLLTPAYH